MPDESTPRPDAAPNPTGVGAALDHLLAGNRRFAAGAGTEHSVAPPEDHAPLAAVLACADARVAPTVVFDVPLGALFSVRIAGAVPNAAALASLAFAVDVLGVGLVIVLGHDDCGAVRAAVDLEETGGITPPGLAAVVDPVRQALRRAGPGIPEPVDAVVTRWMELLRGAKSPLAGPISRGEVVLAGGVVPLGRGAVRMLD
jgi:carbonic anhydrase